MDKSGKDDNEMNEPAAVIRMGYITYINRELEHNFIQIDGVGLEGIIIHADNQTSMINREGTPLSFDQLKKGMLVEIEHRVAMTMSLPPQTYAYSIRIMEE